MISKISRLKYNLEKFWVKSLILESLRVKNVIL